MITVAEIEAFVNGAGVGKSLIATDFNVLITKGIPSRLFVSGSPVTEYASSLGGNMLAEEVRYRLIEPTF